MKKVALITFHAAHNNGSFLQAFATQKLIQQLGYNCDILNFSTPRQQYIYAVYKTILSPKDLIKNAYALLHHKLIQKRHDDFTNLVHAALKLSQATYSDPSEMQELEDTYDIFVSGSDQIWNMDAWDYSDAYFLSFVHNKPKISYASSMGGHILSKAHDESLKSIYQRMLSSYAAVSVREKSAQQFLQPLLDQPVIQVLDPTLLLKKDDYAAITAPCLVNEPYIFYYAIDAIELNDSAAKMVQKFAAQKKLPVVVMFTGNKSFKLKKYGFHLLREAAPNHYLSLIQNAEYVLSASFHGTAFSILFHKNFHVVRGLHDGVVNMDDRITSLLQLCKLENRQLIEGQPWDESEIDYQAVDTRLKEEQNHSLQYLQNALAIERTDQNGAL